MRPEVLALIPARGGSKGIPRKNLARLGGLPLIAHTIRAALASRHITRLVVSTEDEEIAEVSRSFGAEVPFLRPASLARDGSNMAEAFSHALALLKEQGYQPQSILILLPTSPFRTPRFIDALTATLLQGYRSVMTVKAMPCGEKYYARSGRCAGMSQVRLDKARHLFRQYGVYYGENLSGSFSGSYMHVVSDPVMLIDVDTPQDLAFAEAVVRENLFDFALPG